MNPNGHLATLKPLKPGENSARSLTAMAALRKCRKLSPETVDFLISVMRNPEEATPVRVKCAEIILDKALPSPRARNDQTTAALDGDGRTTHLTIEFVNSAKPIVLEHEPVTNGHGPASNGHHTTPIDIVFVKPEDA